jgi:hypothetical protein
MISKVLIIKLETKNIGLILIIPEEIKANPKRH